MALVNVKTLTAHAMMGKTAQLISLLILITVVGQIRNIVLNQP